MNNEELKYGLIIILLEIIKDHNNPYYYYSEFESNALLLTRLL